MKYKMIVSAHLYLDEKGNKDIEILDSVHNDDNYTGVFDDVDHAMLEQIEVDLKSTDDYYFMAIIESEFVESRSWEGSEWDVEHEVTEIKKIEDIYTNTK